jgi:hypothetical protein
MLFPSRDHQGVGALGFFTDPSATGAFGFPASRSGARRSSVRTLVLQQGAALSAAGSAIGIVASLASMQFHVRPVDPLTLASVA